jgi:hypothetical protein
MVKISGTAEINKLLLLCQKAYFLLLMATVFFRRTTYYESVGRRFESYWARQQNQGVSGISANPFFLGVK